MTDDPPPLTDLGDARERSLIEDVRQLVEDGRTLAEAEFAYQKSRAVVAGQGIKDAAAWGALAAALTLFALLALTVGLLLALVPLLGPWGATGAVTGGLLLAALLCGLVAKGRWQAMTGAIAENDPPR